MRARRKAETPQPDREIVKVSKPILTSEMLVRRRFWKKRGLAKKEHCGNLRSLGENGEIILFTAFSEKNGKNQEY